MFFPIFLTTVDTPIINNCYQPELISHCHFSIAENHELLSSTDTEEDTSQFEILPVGINLGNRNVLQSSFVRGYEDGEKAINFNNWLISWQDLTTALNLKVTNLANGEIEIRGVGLVKRIHTNELKTDPELGLVLSIADIEEILDVKAQFDIISYAIIFEPPWLNLRNSQTHFQETPIILEGLPVVNASEFTFSTLGQQVNLSGKQNDNEVTSQGDLQAIGTILGGSWFSRIEQPDLFDSKTWQLAEGQYLRQGDFNDYVIGSQPTFWQTQSQGDYWGVTTVSRFGFKADDLNGSSFIPSQRLYSKITNRTIEGVAEPGTLVRLVSGNERRVLEEVLVDFSGIYRFQNIPITGNTDNYKILLYPKGQLASTPIEEEPIFLHLPGQLTKGTSSLVLSTGLSKEVTSNNFFGEFNNLRGGFAYRHGISDSLTLGTGLVYDNSVLALADLFYQPSHFPLILSLSASKVEENIKHNANFQFRVSPKLNLNLSSNERFQNANLNWNIAKGLSLSSSANNANNIINNQINFNYPFGDLLTYSSFQINNKGQLDFSSNARRGNWNFSSRANANHKRVDLTYEDSIFNLPGNESLIVNYETIKLSNKSNDLLALRWKYQSPSRLNDRRSIWDLDIGYGIGSQGSGLLASVSTIVLPGLSMGLRYDGVSAISDTPSFRIELSSAANFSPTFSPADTRFEQLRSEGGMLIQAFLDHNSNGIRDHGEAIITEDIELLLTLNNQKINPTLSSISKRGVSTKLSPGMYRLDLDPAGYPIDWKPSQFASAIEVVAGSYTKVSIPFTPSYTLAGTLIDLNGNPVAGARIEAINTKTKSSIISITNSSGIFYLEQLQQGTYQLIVNNQLIKPQITIDANSQTFQELNLQLPVIKK